MAGLIKVLDRSLWFLICLIPFIHLFVFDESIYPYVTSKHFLFRFLLLIGVGLWSILALCELRFRVRSSALFKSFILFLVVILIADFFGADFNNSFWSNYARMDGYISLLYYFLLFIVLSTSLNSSKRWAIYFHLHLLSSFIIFIFAALQKNKMMLAVDYNRVDASFGNSSYLAIFASLCFFLSLYLFFSTSNKWLRGWLLLVALCNLLSIYLSQTRSATLGLLFAAAFFIFITAKNKWKALGWGALGLGLFGLSIYFFKDRNHLSTNLFQRLSEMSLKDESIKARIEIWKYCGRAILENPLWGWGQENYLYLMKLYEPDMWATPWVDRAHNLILEWLVQAGFFGLLALLALLGSFLVLLVRLPNEKMGRLPKAALFGLLICWLVNQLVSIDFFSITVLFYSLLAYVQFRSFGDQTQIGKALSHSRLRLVFGAVVFLLVSVGINYELNVRGARTNYQIRQLTKPDVILAEAEVKPFQSQMDNLLTQRNYFENPEIRVYLAQNALFMWSKNQDVPGKYQDYLQFIYQRADAAFQRQILEAPEQLVYKYTAASFYTQFHNFAAADDLYREILAKSPRHQYFLAEYGHVKLLQGRTDEAIELYRQAWQLAPEYNLPRMYIALGLVYAQRFAEANVITDALLKENLTEAFDERLINAYLNNKQPEKASQLIEARRKYLESRP